MLKILLERSGNFGVYFVKNIKSPPKFQEWIDARKKHHLSHAHVQMAKELGMNPKKLGKIDNHKQEPWKAPLPEFIEHLYLKSFKSERPIEVKTLEETVKLLAQKKAGKKEKKALEKSLLKKNEIEFDLNEFCD